MFKLCGRYVPTTILVECPEGELDHLLVLRVAHLVWHHLAELAEIYLTWPIRIILETETDYCNNPFPPPTPYFINKLQQLCLRRVHPHGPHAPAQLLGAHQLVPVCVEQVEGLLQLCALLHGEAVAWLHSCVGTDGSNKKDMEVDGHAKISSSFRKSWKSFKILSWYFIGETGKGCDNELTC